MPDVVGCSMGARIAAFLALRASPSACAGWCWADFGLHLVDEVGLPVSIAEALEAPSLADVHDPVGRTFRAFTEATQSD